MIKKLRILVVDDDRDFAEGVADVLELAGHQVAIAHDGDAALERFIESEFDLTFMDIKLPGRSGVEHLREFQRRFPGARVVLMTAFSLDGLVDESIERNILGAFHKPLAFPQVQTVLDQVQHYQRVLIVDDDVDFAREMRDLLEVAGFSVRSCFDGQSAIRRCLEEPFDAMVLDLRLPGASGAEVYSAVREARPDLRIVRVTGFDNEMPEEESSESTMFVDKVLHKPFHPDRLLQLLEVQPGAH